MNQAANTEHMINVRFTQQEVQAILQVLSRAPLPYTTSHPLIQKISMSINNAGMRQGDQLATDDAQHDSAADAQADQDARIDRGIVDAGEASHDREHAD